MSQPPRKFKVLEIIPLFIPAKFEIGRCYKVGTCSRTATIFICNTADYFCGMCASHYLSLNLDGAQPRDQISFSIPILPFALPKGRNSADSSPFLRNGNRGRFNHWPFKQIIYICEGVSQIRDCIFSDDGNSELGHGRINGNKVMPQFRSHDFRNME